MADKVQRISENMAQKFLDKERKVGKMMATVTTLFFLVFLVTPVMRVVRFITRFKHFISGVYKKYRIIYHAI